MKERGFTLLELMLVIALIAAISLVGLSVYRQQLLNFQIDKTALQLQQWLQAGQAYYQDCGFWPDPNQRGMAQLLGQEITCNGNDKKLKVPVQYMPPGSDKNGPFGNSYFIDPTWSPADPTRGKLFPIQTRILSAMADNVSLAKRVGARLPLAVVNPMSGLLTASVGIPGPGGSKKPGFMVVQIKEVVSGGVVFKPGDPRGGLDACPDGTDPKIYVSMKQFHPAGGGYDRKHYTPAPRAIAGIQASVEEVWGIWIPG